MIHTEFYNILKIQPLLLLLHSIGLQEVYRTETKVYGEAGIQITTRRIFFMQVILVIPMILKKLKKDWVMLILQ